MKIYGFFEGFRPTEDYLNSFCSVIGDKEKKLIEFKSLSDAILALKNKEINYLIVPSRATYTNETNIILMDIIDRMNYAKICEIYTFVDKGFHLKEKATKSYKDVYYFGTSIYKKVKNRSSLKENELNYIEFKIFETNKLFDLDHKKEIRRSLLNKLYTTKGGKISSYLIVLLPLIQLIAVIAFLKIYWLDTLSLALTLLTTLFKVAEQMLDFKDKYSKEMIKGYWLYYSFERDFSSGNFVPRGFTTRMLEINNKPELLFNCWIEGNDSLFFTASENHFKFDATNSLGTGSYHYVSNFVNSNGLRADGICSFSGHALKNQLIITMDGWFSGRGTGIRGFVKYIRISKEQFDFIKEHPTPDRSQSFCAYMKIGVYGEPKSNTDVALDNYPDFSEIIFSKHFKLSKVYYRDLSSMLNDLNTRRIDACIIPVNNSNAKVQIGNGSPDSLFNIALKRKQNITLWKEFYSPIKHSVCSTNRNFILNNQTRFVSNRNVLNQCSNYIGDRNTNDQYVSSSEAAKDLALGLLEKNDVVICNKEAASYYNLFILKDNIANEIDNKTKFAIYLNSDFYSKFK